MTDALARDDEATRATRVVVVGDDPLARAGISLLATSAGAMVVAQLATSEDIVTRATETGAHAVLWDLGPDRTRVLERAREATESGLPLVVLVPDDSNAVEVASLGVRGVLLRDADGEMIYAATNAARRGLFVLDPDLARVALRVQRAPAEQTQEALTPREIEVLELLGAGMPNKAIAAQLHISEHTVKFHVNAIMQKLGAGSRTDAVVKAARLGLVRI